MAHPRGESGSDAVRLDFDRRLMLQFRGSPVSNPLEHLAPMLLPIFRQIEQKALVERAPRSFRRAARIS